MASGVASNRASNVESPDESRRGAAGDSAADSGGGASVHSDGGSKDCEGAVGSDRKQRWDRKAYNAYQRDLMRARRKAKGQ